jgi:hypothetical protein
MPRGSWIAALIAILLVAGSGLAIWSSRAEPAAEPEPAQPKIASITAAQVQAFQAQADAACLRARQGDAEGWAEFDRALARYDHRGSDTLCAEESVSQVCFPPFDEFGEGGTCILRARSYDACSAEEERSRRAEARARQEQGCSD